MRTIYCFILSLFLFTDLLPAQVIVNEVYPSQNSIELKNIGNETADLNSFFLCNDGNCKNVGTLTPFCGFNTLEPGEIKAFTFNNVDYQNGEIAVFKSDQFNNPDDLTSYVQWGFPGHQAESIASQAGIWSPGDFVQSSLEFWSLEYDGDGNGSSDWNGVAVHTRCEENGNSCNLGSNTIVSAKDEYELCAGDGNNNIVEFELASSLAGNEYFLVHDEQGQIYELFADGKIDFEDFPTGRYYVTGLGYEVQLGGLELGNNINELYGCYTLSDSIIVNIFYTPLNAGSISDINGQTEFTFCVVDNEDDFVELTNTSPDNDYSYIISNQDNSVLVASEASVGFNFEGSGSGIVRIWGVSYTGELIINEGQQLFEDEVANGCYNLSQNFITVDRKISGEGCTTSITDIDDNEANFSLFPNPAQELIEIEYNPALFSEDISYRIYSLGGTLVKWQKADRQQSKLIVDLQSFNSGYYIIQLKSINQTITKSFIKN